MKGTNEIFAPGPEIFLGAPAYCQYDCTILKSSISKKLYRSVEKLLQMGATWFLLKYAYRKID